MSNRGSDQANYGGHNKLEIRCPSCNYRLTLIDSQFMEHGPIRCGACGSQIRQSLATRVLEEAVTSGPSRRR